MKSGYKSTKNAEGILSEAVMQATRLHMQGQWDEAEKLYSAILKAQPSHFDAKQLFGDLRFRQGRFDEAQNLLREAIAIKRNVAQVHLTLGKTLAAMKRHQDALKSFDNALALQPGFAEVYYERGHVARLIGRFKEALESYDNVITLRPNSFEAYNSKGVLLKDLGRLDDALVCYEEALTIKPDYVEAHNNRGNVLVLLNRMADALSSFERALEIKPDYAEAHINHGIVLMELNRTTDALASFNKALTIQPCYPAALYNRSLLALLSGRLTSGWDGYESRFDPTVAVSERLDISCPLWGGEDIKDKRILVFDEQGVGDIIQFTRYLNLLLKKGADVTFFIRPNMIKILSSILDGVRAITQMDAGFYDYQVALLSLPKQFQTTLETIPASTAYLQAEMLLVNKWRRALGPQGLKVGIAWQGNPAGKVDIGRSIPLRCFATLAAIPGVRLISLQKNHGLDQLADRPPHMPVETLGPNFDEGPDAFIDTAAVMANLDLIITSDTSIAHLAGALGRPVWLALKHVPDWRWLLDRADSPWYPTMRLYRQSTRGDWEGVFARIALDLTRFELDGCESEPS